MWRSAAFSVTVFSLSCSACGGRARSSVSSVTPDAGAKLTWTFGGGAQDVIDVVQDRAGNLYVAMNVTESMTLKPVVVALDSKGRELWRIGLSDSAIQSLTSDGAGDVWARGTASLSRISASGELRWNTALASVGPWRGALGPDGSSYYYYAVAGSSQVFLQALAADGSAKWNAPLGGNTSRLDGAHVTSFGAPAIGPQGRVYAPCAPCANGKSGVVGFDPMSGSQVATAPGDPEAAGATVNTLHGVTIDGDGNIYYGYGPNFADPAQLASADPSGGVRWTSSASQVPESSALVPVLVGSTALGANSDLGLVDLSSKDGSVISQVAVQGAGPLVALLSGGLGLVAKAFSSGSGALAGQSQGAAIVDATGAVVWSDPTLPAAKVLVGKGVLYGVEQEPPTGAGRLVAKQAPVDGLGLSAWAMAGHDLGRTSSASGTW